MGRIESDNNGPVSGLFSFIHFWLLGIHPSIYVFWIRSRLIFLCSIFILPINYLTCWWWRWCGLVYTISAVGWMKMKIKWINCSLFVCVCMCLCVMIQNDENLKTRNDDMKNFFSHDYIVSMFVYNPNSV